MTADRRSFINLEGAGALALSTGRIGAGEQAGFPDIDRLRREHAQVGIISPGQTYRAMEWEFHTPLEQTFDIDLKGAIAASHDASAESLMFYTQNHWGYAFYPSDTAVRHPNLKFDLFGTEYELARKAGIAITSYYSLQFNNQCAIHYPEWAWTNEKGGEQRFYEKAGGTLISSYRYGLPDEERDVFGFDYDGEEKAYAFDPGGKPREGGSISTYLESAGHPLAEPIANGTVGLPGAFVKMKETTAQVVMCYRLPLLVEDVPNNRWVGWGPVPPGPGTAGAAVAYNRFGKGQSVYIGAPISGSVEAVSNWSRSLCARGLGRFVLTGQSPLVSLGTGFSQRA